MILFPLITLLAILTPQQDPLPVVRYFDQKAAQQTYEFLDPSVNHPLDAQLKTKLKRGLSTVKCQTGLIEVTLEPGLVKEWRRQLTLKDCPGEKCNEKDIRKEIRAALYYAGAQNTICGSDSHTETSP